jgi:CheY-like chemotaxis protein
MEACRILVVDDNQNIHRDFRKIIELAGAGISLVVLERNVLGDVVPPPEPSEFELAFAISGEAAAALVKSAVASARPFAMAFVDMRMPGWDGLETAEQLWKLQSDLAVAFTSAYMDYSWNEVIERLKRPGLRFVPKPWSGSQILAVVHELRARARSPGRHSMPSR